MLPDTSLTRTLLLLVEINSSVCSLVLKGSVALRVTFILLKYSTFSTIHFDFDKTKDSALRNESVLGIVTLTVEEFLTEIESLRALKFLL